MKRAMVMLIYALCASCVMEQTDGFVAAGGLGEINSREQLFERDIVLTLASGDGSYRGLSPQVRSCLVAKAIDHAAPDLLVAADAFLARRTEASWSAYRDAVTHNSATFSSPHLTALTARCVAPNYRVAAS
jgi:hypothetical protein